MKIYIAGEEILCNSTIDITETLSSASSTILNNCYPKKWEETHNYVSNFYMPKDYSNCEIFDDDDNLVFAGVVKNSGNIELNPRKAKFYSLQILDYKTLLSESKTFDFVLNNVTIKQAINRIIENIQDVIPGIEADINLTSADDVIGAYSTLNKTPYDILQYLSEISNSIWCFKSIYEGKTLKHKIVFRDLIALDRAENIQYTPEYFRENNIVNMQYSFNTRDYRNKQTIMSNNVMSNITYKEYFTGDGYTSKFILANNVGKIAKITLNRVNQTFTTNAEKDEGQTAKVYYDKGSNYIEFGTTPQSSAVIFIEYYGLIYDEQTASNSEEISRIGNQLNNSGELSRYETRDDIQSSTELFNIANDYLQFKGKREIELKIETINKDLFNVGEYTHFDFNGLEDLNADYLIKSKDIKIIKNGTTENIKYTYILNSNFNAETTLNYFDNQRRKLKGNLNTGDYIVRRLETNYKTNIIFYGFTATEIKTNSNNKLNSPLNIPFIV